MHLWSQHCPHHCDQQPLCDTEKSLKAERERPSELPNHFTWKGGRRAPWDLWHNTLLLFKFSRLVIGESSSFRVKNPGKRTADSIQATERRPGWKKRLGLYPTFYTWLVFNVGVSKYRLGNIFVINVEVKLSLFVLNSKTFVKASSSWKSWKKNPVSSQRMDY